MRDAKRKPEAITSLFSLQERGERELKRVSEKESERERE